MIHADTICAIATARGGAIGTIRVSGKDALSIVNKVFTPANAKKTLTEREGYTVTFGRICREEEVIDEVLATVFRNPHSYTGEDSVELTCHGSAYILQQVVQLLVDNGCRIALPGEFTQRAFLNGKMDLSQAEAVADLIASTSAATHRLAMNQMRGGFSKELAELRSHLLNFTSMIELELDFGEEDVEFADRDELTNFANRIEETLTRLADSFSVGNAIKNGVPVTIVGETNAGKSTLLNLLLNDDKAIVSDIHGTTRDVIEDTTILGGVLFRFIDTAGIRETEDVIEKLGIDRTFRKIEEAEIVLWLIDSQTDTHHIGELAQRVLPYCEDKKLLVLFNKCDLITPEKEEMLSMLLPVKKEHILFISARNKIHTETLKSKLVDITHLQNIDQNSVIVTNARHYEALTHALEAIHRVQEGLTKNISGDFLSQDIRECVFYLSDILGEVTTDQVLGNIFENFCIGK